MRHSVSISKFIYFIIEQTEKKKNTTEERELSMGFRNKIIKKKNERYSLFVD